MSHATHVAVTGAAHPATVAHPAHVPFTYPPVSHGVLANLGSNSLGCDTIRLDRKRSRSGRPYCDKRNQSRGKNKTLYEVNPKR